MGKLGMMATTEQFSEQDWLNDLYSSSESQRTIVIAKIFLKTFDQFCEKQKSSRMEMIEKYQGHTKYLYFPRQVRAVHESGT